MKFNKDNPVDMMTYEVYKDVVDPNYRAALSELDNIIYGQFLYDDEENPYGDMDKSFMREFAHKLETVIWILVTVGNKAYADINEPATSFERWFIITHQLLLPEIGRMVGAITSLMSIVSGDSEKAIDKLERMNKEFTRTKVCHNIFNVINFADGFKKITSEDDSLSKSLNQIVHTMDDPIVVDNTKVIPILEELIEKLEDDPSVINTVDLQRIICDPENRYEYDDDNSEFNITTDPSWVNCCCIDMGSIVDVTENIVSFADQFDLSGKLNVLAFLNQLIFQTTSYSRHLIRDNIEYDHDEIMNPLLKRIANLRQKLGIKVDEGGNYIGDDTNKLM